MLKAGALATLGTWLMLVGGVARGQGTAANPETGTEVIRAQPAVLILRVTDVLGQDRPTRRLAVVEPRGLKTLPLAADGQSLDYADDGTPRLGSGYELLRSYESSPGLQNTHYYVFSIDFANPDITDRWREFQQAERAERRQARAERRNISAWERRKQHLLDASAQTTQEGLAQLQAGKYREAVISLTRAAEMNQGDPACRIHLAQARIALGHDADAAKALRRALELQPKLVPMVLGLEQYYPHDEDFAVQVDALAERVSGNRSATADEYFLLGFMEFQRGWYDEAYAAFRRVARERPKDTLTRSYLDLAKPAAKGAGPR